MYPPPPRHARRSPHPAATYAGQPTPTASHDWDGDRGHNGGGDGYRWRRWHDTGIPDARCRDGADTSTGAYTAVLAVHYDNVRLR